MSASQSILKPVAGSDLPLHIRKAASKILILAEDPDEDVLISRIKSIEAKGEAKQRLLDLPSAVKIQFETWYLPIYFDPEFPENLLRRDFTAVVKTDTLIRGAFEQGITEWDVSDSFNRASNLGLPPGGYAKLAEEIQYLHEGEIEEWLALGNSLPEGLSPQVLAIYTQYANDFSNDNVEDGLVSDLQEA